MQETGETVLTIPPALFLRLTNAQSVQWPAPLQDSRPPPSQSDNRLGLLLVSEEQLLIAAPPVPDIQLRKQLDNNTTEASTQITKPRAPIGRCFSIGEVVSGSQKTKTRGFSVLTQRRLHLNHSNFLKQKEKKVHHPTTKGACKRSKAYQKRNNRGIRRMPASKMFLSGANQDGGKKATSVMRRIMC